LTPDLDGARLDGLRGVVVNWRDPEHHLAGGSERYAWELASALRDAGASVEFLTSRDTGQTSRAVVDDIRVRRAGGRFTVYLWTLVLLLVRRRRTDFVVDVENGIPSFAPIVLPRRTPVVLVMHHVHLDQFGTHFPLPAALVGRLLERRVMPLVYGSSPVVAVSESTRDEMVRRLRWRGQIVIVHNGAEVATTLGRPEPDRIAVLGRLVVHKRVSRVVDAAAKLRDQHRIVHVDIIGRGPEEENLRKLVADRGCADIVTLHGFVDERTKAELVGRARLHVCASEGEGWGQVVLEAAAAGVPTLAYDVPGLRDSVLPGRTGWLMDPREQVATGVLRALSELGRPGRADEMGAECRAWAEQFTWDDMRARSVQVVAAAVRR
jgi:glycosyltransferase involved in cell wall biosynthesis